ncbi:hypothetical protein [Barnesiella intestinihominis]|uniref:hypothetical protein n=1 Tax=Barnesiella intestinihominis TaxID=487174 RepID=UPI003AB83CEB
MAGKKISQLDKLTELTGTEIIPVAKDGQNYGVETLALLGISVYDIPEPLDDNYIYTPEQLAEIKKSIEDGKIIRFGGWSMPTVYFLEDDGEMVFDIDNGDWSRVIFTIKANGEWEINPPVDFFNYVVEMPNIVEGEELTGTLPAETFGDLLERLKRSGNVMFRYPQAGGSLPVNQYDIGISFRYYQTNATIIHAEGTREFYITPSGNYTDRPVVSKQYQLITTRLNDYMYDMSGLLGKLAVKGAVGADEKQVTDGSYYDVNGNLVPSTSGGYAYQKLTVDPSKVYELNILFTGGNVSTLVLFDENDNVIHNLPCVAVSGNFVFTGVTSIGVTFDKNNEFKYVIKSFNLQDLTTVLNTQQGNRALYVAAGAVYNQNTGFYELNGLTDITEEEMREIYIQTHHVTRQTDLSGVFANVNNIRTNYPFKIDSGYKQVLCHATFAGCTNIEVVAFTKSINNVFYSTRVNYLFQNCRKLKKVIGIIRMDYASSSEKYEKMFYQCSALVFVSLRGVKYDISFSDSPLISLESLQFMITNAANTSPIIVTVHADVYAKIQDETNAEWHALMEMAAAKQITFATA